MATKTVKVKTTTECPWCEGKGYTQEAGKGIEGFHRCPHCHGDGVLKNEENKTVTVDE